MAMGYAATERGGVLEPFEFELGPLGDHQVYIVYFQTVSDLHIEYPRCFGAQNNTVFTRQDALNIPPWF